MNCPFSSGNMHSAMARFMSSLLGIVYSLPQNHSSVNALVHFVHSRTLSVRSFAHLPNQSFVPHASKSSFGSLPLVSIPQPWLISSPLDQCIAYNARHRLLGIPCHPQRRGSNGEHQDNSRRGSVQPRRDHKLCMASFGLLQVLNHLVV